MTNFRPPLPPELAACRGLSPSERADLIAGAKSRAMRFVWAVKGGHAAEVYRLTEDMGKNEWAALAVVLAEAVKPGDMRLALVVRAADDESTEGAA